MNHLQYCVKVLGIAISGAVVLSTNSAIAQIEHNGNLSNSYNVTAQDNIKTIPTNTQYQTNLSSSFDAWCVPCPATGDPYGCNC